MAIGSKELTPIELDTYEDERLLDELKKAKEELFNLRFQSATGQLESHGRLRAVKRDIARIYTVIRERELGIRATPAPLETPAKAKRSTKKDDVKSEAAPDAPVAEATEDAPVAAEPEKAPKAKATKEAK
jgi:large subunit ribosomal protein L29